MRNRELHAYIRRRIERELKGRSWNWLADASGISQSTLNDQANGKFSVAVLVRVAWTLQVDPAYFLPPRPDGGSAAQNPEEVITLGYSRRHRGEYRADG